MFAASGINSQINYNNLGVSASSSYNSDYYSDSVGGLLSGSLDVVPIVNDLNVDFERAIDMVYNNLLDVAKLDFNKQLSFVNATGFLNPLSGDIEFEISANLSINGIDFEIPIISFDGYDFTISLDVRNMSNAQIADLAFTIGTSLLGALLSDILSQQQIGILMNMANITYSFVSFAIAFSAGLPVIGPIISGIFAIMNLFGVFDAIFSSTAGSNRVKVMMWRAHLEGLRYGESIKAIYNNYFEKIEYDFKRELFIHAQRGANNISSYRHLLDGFTNITITFSPTTITIVMPRANNGVAAYNEFIDEIQLGFNELVDDYIQKMSTWDDDPMTNEELTFYSALGNSPLELLIESAAGRSFIPDSIGEELGQSFSNMIASKSTVHFKHLAYQATGLPTFGI